jgi:hypothetical protein
MTKAKRHSWTDTTSSWAGSRPPGGEYTAVCRNCGLTRHSSGYHLERTYQWEEPPEVSWRERAPACPPDLSTGTARMKK